MKSISVISVIIILMLTLDTNAQVSQFPQVYYNGQGSGGSNLLIHQSNTYASTTLDMLGSSSKIGAISLSTNSTQTWMNWVQVCLPSTSSTNNSPSYGYMPCEEFYARIDASNNYATVNTSSTPLGVRTCANCTSSYVTISGQNAYYGRNSILALTGNTSSGWYEIYLTTNCSQSTGWVNGTYLTFGNQSYNILGGRICDNASNCNFYGNINSATITLGSLGTTFSSGGFYQYKVANGWSGTITCTHPNYTTSSPVSYSYTATGNDFTRNFIMSNTSSCTTPSASVNSQSGPSPVTLTCSASGGSGGPIAYKWYSGTSCNGTPIGTNSTYDATATGSYTCKAYITGFESTCFICNTGSATVTTTSSCTPPTASVDNPSGPSPLTITCTASGGSGGNILYKWYNGTSCSGASIGTNSTYNATATGSYSCKAYISGYESTCNFCSSGSATITTTSSSGSITASLGSGYFIQGVSTINNTFTITGAPAGTTRVVFHATGATDVTDNSSSSWTAQFDMGSLGPNTVVYAQYYNGTTLLGYSPNYSLNILSKPSWLNYATISNVSCSGGVISLNANYPFQSVLNNIPYNIKGLSGKRYSVTNNALTFAINFTMSNRSSTITNSKLSLILNALDQAINAFDISIPANLSSGLHLDNNFNLIAIISGSVQTPHLAVDIPGIAFPVDPFDAIQVSVDAGVSIYGALKAELVIGQNGGQWGFIDNNGNKTKVTAVIYPSAFIRGELSILYGAASGEATLDIEGRVGGGFDYVSVPSPVVSPLFGGDIDIYGTAKIKAFWGLWTIKTYGPKSFYYGMFGDTSAFRATTQSFEQRFGTNSVTYRKNATLELPGNAPQPSLANRENNVYGVWVENTQSLGRLCFSRLDTTVNKFTSSITIASNENSITNPKVAIMPNGTALISWAQNRYTSSTLPTNISAKDVLQAEDIWFAIYDPLTNNVSDVTRITDDTATYQSGRLEGQPVTSFNSDTSGIIAWVVKNSSLDGSDIWYIQLSKSMSGWTFSAPSQLSHLSGSNRSISISYLDTVKTMAVWINDPDAIDTNFNSQVVYSIWNGNSWSTESPVSINSNINYTSVSVASNHDKCIVSSTSSVISNVGRYNTRLEMNVWDSQINQWDASQSYYEEDSNKSFSKPNSSINNSGIAAVGYQCLNRYPDSLNIDAGKVKLYAKDLNNTGSWVKVNDSEYLSDSSAYIWELAYSFGSDNNMYTLTQEYNETGVVNHPKNGVIFGDPNLSLVLRGLQIDNAMSLLDIKEPEGPLGISTNELEKFSLLQNYPNPFDRLTQIQFNLNHTEFVSLEVFDALGAKINSLISRQLSPGIYTTLFDAGSLKSGVYFYTLTIGGERTTKQMVLIAR